MKRRNFLQIGATWLLASALPGSAGTQAPDIDTLLGPHAALGSRRRFGDGRDWWFQKRFGLFVHWGLYALDGWQEQEQYRRRIPRADYVKLAQRWNPAKFDPDAWLDLAAKAGMQYICFTTKHADGFCLWNTKQTDYNVMNTPYGKDALKMLADACHRRGVPLCLYYSIVDWHHPNYPNQGRHHELPPQPHDQPDLMKYLEFLKEQVRELCSNYGEIHGFWWDTNVDQRVDPSINDMIRQLQPKAVINNRGFDQGDFGTPERDFEKTVNINERTEACQSVGSESWGYRQDEDYYADRYLIRNIDKYLAQNGHYLLNVGPKSDGTIPEESAAILRRIGKWFYAVKEALYDTIPVSQSTANPSVLLTRKGNILYVHLSEEPLTDAVKLKSVVVAPRRATLLNTGQPLEFAVEQIPSSYSEPKPFLRLRKLPVNKLANTVLVAKLEFDDLPENLIG